MYCCIRDCCVNHKGLSISSTKTNDTANVPLLTLHNYLGWPDFLKKGPPTIEDGRPLHFPTPNNSTTFLRAADIFVDLLSFPIHNVRSRPCLLIKPVLLFYLADVLLCNFLEYQYSEMCCCCCLLFWHLLKTVLDFF